MPLVTGVAFPTYLDVQEQAKQDREKLNMMNENKSTISVVMKDIVQEYPTADGKSNLVINGVNLSFVRPEINMLLGPSGCGKSTLLRMMGGVRPLGIQTPTNGTVLIDNEECVGPHNDAVMVFQQYANRPDMNVFDNVAFPFRLKLWKGLLTKAEWTERVNNILESVGLSDKKDLYPSQLSGGQNQRVALARALVLRPRLLLMDEPFGALDPQTRSEMQELLLRLHKENPCVVVFVTHDVTEALTLADRVLVMSTQPANIADDFPIITAGKRDSAWHRTPEAIAMEQRILMRLHEANPGKNVVRVSV